MPLVTKFILLISFIMLHSKTYQIFLLIIIFLAIGFLTVLFTHQSEESDNQVKLNNSQVEITQPIRDFYDRPIAAEAYVKIIKPWLEAVSLQPDLDQIRYTKDKLENFQSSNPSLGSAHIQLFLAFDAWEEYLMSKDEQFKDRALERLTQAANLLPDLAGIINNLQLSLK